MSTREALALIVSDMRADAAARDGQPLDGRTIAEALGQLGAAIATIAEIVASMLPPDGVWVRCKGCDHDVRLTADGKLPLHPINPALKPSPWCKARTEYTLIVPSASTPQPDRVGQGA